MPTLEERVQVIEDREEIRRLKGMYARYTDAKYDLDGIVSLFTEDAVFDCTDFGAYQGHEAIREYYGVMQKNLTFTVHYHADEIIDIDPSGETATGSCYFLDFETVQGQPLLVAGTYEDQYKKVDGKWKVAHMKVNFLFRIDWNSDWVKERLVSGNTFLEGSESIPRYEQA
ncbi:MAG: nuclear transport factor 2 family protein [Chloroflexi bacterium]|nr:nuclear transport factor 2 family protein [Chloroflexota bacterium]